MQAIPSWTPLSSEAVIGTVRIVFFLLANG